MNTIDQRILIPAPPDTVWEYISNIQNNPQWQSDCLDVKFLTTTHRGTGTRWRKTSARGKTHVVEIKTWYERLGYEYEIIDGVSYKSNQGMIRLQDTPEGTIVQWTFHYEPSGILGGMRNTLATKRNIDNTVVESLWALWQHINQLVKTDDSAYTAKSLIREAPDVQERSQYTPRHPSVLNREGDSEILKPTIQINEPPISQDDTKPRPTVTLTEKSDHVSEPDFLDDVAAPKDNAATEIEGLNAETNPAQKTEVHSDDPAKIDDVQNIPVVEMSDAPDESSGLTAPVLNRDRFELPQIEEEVSQRDIREAPTTSLEDTSEVSVFDVFGLPKPSESEQIRTSDIREQLAATATSSASVKAESPAPADTNTGRTGLRILMRRKSIKIRQAGN